MKNKTIIQFICYNPRIYSGFDNFQIKLTSELSKINYKNVLVYSDELKVEKLRIDIQKSGAILELISTKNIYTKTRDLFKLYSKYNPSFTHSHFENSIHIISAILSFIFRTKHFFSFWSEISSLSISEYSKSKGLFKLYILRLYYKTLILLSDRCLFGSKAVTKQFISFSGSKSPKIQTFYLGTEIYINNKDVNTLKKEMNIPGDAFVISNISAIEHIKGIQTLIDALGILKNTFKIDKFICIHVGTLRSEYKAGKEFLETLEEKIKNNGLESNFIWLKFINDITDVLKISHLYAHPSLQEGLGSANLEAATQSLPIIATNVGGIPEIVKHQTNGFLFEPEDSKTFAELLKTLIENEQLRDKMGRESLEIVTNEFNMIKQTVVLKDLYVESTAKKDF